jgi:murein DD-endopeptidase MepM/ murein hydrolase activator NlpD
VDVWSDDVLKEILSETRRRRSHRRWLRAASVSAALAAGIGLALFVARSTDEVPANSKIATSEPAQPAAGLATDRLAKDGLAKDGTGIDLGSIVEPIVSPLAITPVATPGSGITQAVVDVLLSALPDTAPPSGAGPMAAAGTPGVPAAPEPIAPLVEDEIRSGDTLLAALARHGVAASTAFAIARELEPHFDLRRSRPGHRYRIERDEQGALIAFRYDVSDLEHYQVTQRSEGWETRAAKRGVIRQQARLAGVVATTRYDAIGDLGEHPELASEFANIFAWDVDFAKGVHAGDEFHLLYERNYVAREGGGGLRYVGPGRILAARYQSGGRAHEAIFYETEPGVGNYYREDGSPVQQGFLAAPVKYTRISSSFTHARFHPILRKTRPHPGIDYAAPVGTPVWAVAEGRVTHAGWQGGYGRLVKIQHADGYESFYAHLSGFAKGIRVGQKVGQKQVIGYVGSSGLSTGPHVCFRISKHKKFVNPASTRIPSGERIAGRQRQDFETIRDARLAQLIPATLVAVDEAM